MVVLAEGHKHVYINIVIITWGLDELIKYPDFINFFLNERWLIGGSYNYVTCQNLETETMTTHEVTHITVQIIIFFKEIRQIVCFRVTHSYMDLDGRFHTACTYIRIYVHTSLYTCRCVHT